MSSALGSTRLEDLLSEVKATALGIEEGRQLLAAEATSVCRESLGTRLSFQSPGGETVQKEYSAGNGRRLQCPLCSPPSHYAPQ